jgi:hypothetical protein
MKSVVIYSIGSCDASTRIGSYDALLDFEGRTRRLHRELHDTTANRLIIQGLIDAVCALKEPCQLKLTTATAIGVSKSALKKGVNADAVHELLEALTKGRHAFDFDVREGEGEHLRRTIMAHPYNPT